jgi:hypothetical protein
LEGLSGVASDLSSQYLHEVAEELVAQMAGTIASSAWKPLLIDLSAVASEAHNLIFIVHSLFFLRFYDLAINFLLFTLNVLLAALALGGDGSINTGIFNISPNLGSHVLSRDACKKFFFVSLNVSILREVLEALVVHDATGLVS